MNIKDYQWHFGFMVCGWSGSISTEHSLSSGGGFVAGSSRDPQYNLSYIVENSVAIGKPIIGVSINYRLSAFGFLASNEIAGEGATNLGLKDQRLAMHWVQENIAAFGGDPTKVTIWGESAGSQAVGFHLAAYGGRDDKIFRGAIMESGNPVYWISLYTPDYFQDTYDTIVGSAGCNTSLDTLQCLREVSTDTLNTIINTTTPALIAGANWTVYAPVMDGDFLQKYTSLQLQEGQFVHVPILSGANSDEGSVFSPYGINTTEEFYDALTSFQNFPAVPPFFADQILEAYPNDPTFDALQNLGDAQAPAYPYGDQFRRVATYYGDGLIIAGRRQACQTWAAAGNPDVGVKHGQEIPFAFLNLNVTGDAPETVRLAQFMDGSWISFVHDLNPNVWRNVWKGDEAFWPEYSVDGSVIVLDTNVTVHTEPDIWREAAINLINDNSAGIFNR
ncbi:hypothetical protein A1O1_01531 [Capronia coronata CBS 617.96]|uniref:Carboxylic ester hydrolase n=1 Tax=Capronia coronata CBS 617.96 TaxID=1182541 RepID=W9Z385_9EURO|nr:uncharacterized protein A1O1_01531 [Capronia coronata CBS 617.96]EXJ96405.1 hypothetical protein A1O1_01531 [Capronia coronata CBS 617.96]